MRRPLTSSALAAVLLVVVMMTPGSVKASSTEAVAGASRGDSPIAQTDETVTPDKSTSVPSQDPVEAERPARFDSLWLVIVGVVGLLLLIGIVRTQRSWDSSSHPMEQPGQESDSNDPLEEE